MVCNRLINDLVSVTSKIKPNERWNWNQSVFMARPIDVRSLIEQLETKSCPDPGVGVVVGGKGVIDIIMFQELKAIIRIR